MGAPSDTRGSLPPAAGRLLAVETIPWLCLRGSRCHWRPDRKGEEQAPCTRPSGDSHWSRKEFCLGCIGPRFLEHSRGRGPGMTGRPRVLRMVFPSDVAGSPSARFLSYRVFLPGVSSTVSCGPLTGNPGRLVSTPLKEALAACGLSSGGTHMARHWGSWPPPVSQAGPCAGLQPRDGSQVPQDRSCGRGRVRWPRLLTPVGEGGLRGGGVSRPDTGSVCCGSRPPRATPVSRAPAGGAWQRLSCLLIRGRRTFSCWHLLTRKDNRDHCRKF